VSRLAAVILAAGAGSRLGGIAKALLRRGEHSYLETVASLARCAGAGELVVVVAEPHRQAVAAEAGRLGLDVAVNPAPERGMSSSVAAGFAHALDRFGADAALLWPVDHPAVTPATLAALAGAAGDIRVPVHLGRGGHPTVFSRAIWPELAACADLADGARAVVRANPARVTRVEVTDPGVVADVDLPQDLP